MSPRLQVGGPAQQQVSGAAAGGFYSPPANLTESRYLSVALHTIIAQNYACLAFLAGFFACQKVMGA